MRSPTLAELPPAPLGKTGWPWTAESVSLPDTMPDGKDWPLISVVTPSFNQGQYIEETIRSVLLQGYPNLEFIIIDGGSTDDTTVILKKYSSWLSFWVSEKDRGQTHAINIGLDVATGEIAAYLNSDDLYLPGALAEVGHCFHTYQADVVVGRRKPHARAKLFLIRPVWWNNVALKPYSSLYVFNEKIEGHIPQECTFWSLVKYKDLRLDESYHFSMDQWLYVNIFSGAAVVYTTRKLGYFRYHPKSKSATLGKICKENMERLRAHYAPFAEHVTESAQRQLRKKYYWESLKAVFLRAIKTFRFGYHHPPYL